MILCISVFVPIEDIGHLSCVDKNYYKSIDQNPEFWKRKFIFDFNIHNLSITPTDWKHTYFNHGKITVFGSNVFGQLGNNVNDTKNWGDKPALSSKLGKPVNLCNPISIKTIRAKKVFAGHLYSMLIDLNDYVWSFGENDIGQLGLGDIKNRNLPTPIFCHGDKMKAKQISLGNSHSLLIDMEDYVWSFGNNKYGQLGLCDNDNRLVPVQVFLNGLPLKAKDVSAGESHSFIIDLQDNLISFGRNFSGELGVGDVIDRNYPVILEELKAKSVSCGGYHTLIIDLEDNLWVTGNNIYYQLGIGNGTFIEPKKSKHKVKSIATGSFHSAFIDLEDNVWTFGYNDFGQLGLHDKKLHSIPTQISQIKAKSVHLGYLHTLIVDFDNNIYCTGNSTYNQLGLNSINDVDVLTQIPNLKGKQISGGVAHTILI